MNGPGRAVKGKVIHFIYLLQGLKYSDLELGAGTGLLTRKPLQQLEKVCSLFCHGSEIVCCT